MRSERVGRAHGLFPILAKRTPRSCNPLDVTDLVIDRAIVADLMNGQPPPMQNGFPGPAGRARRFGVYGTKHLSWIRALITPGTSLLG
jgi:hypothetical protein